MARGAGIYLNLDPEVLEMIDERCGGPSYRRGEKRSGRTGGRAAWVRKLIHRELGLPPPVDPHEERKRRFRHRIQGDPCPVTHRVSHLEWARTVQRVLELNRQGKSLREIASTLDGEGRPTRRGGRWAPQTVRNILLSEADRRSQGGTPQVVE